MKPSSAGNPPRSVAQVLVVDVTSPDIRERGVTLVKMGLGVPGRHGYRIKGS